MWDEVHTTVVVLVISLSLDAVALTDYYVVLRSLLNTSIFTKLDHWQFT